MPRPLPEQALAPVGGGELPSLRSWPNPPREQAEAPTPSTPPTPARPEVNALLPASGPGFYAYASAARRYGRPETIQALLAIGAAWQGLHPSGPRIGIGSISLNGGGPMPPHRSHQDGLDVDLRPVRSDGREAPTTWRDPAYSRAATQRLVDLLLGNRVLGVQRILFNDPAVTGVRAYLGHDDHLHVRLLPPAARRPETQPAQPPDRPPPPPGAAQPAGGPPPPRPVQSPGGSPPPAAGPGALSGPGLGVLVGGWRDGRRFRYRLTPADLLWTARLAAGADGAREAGRLVRAMLRRFAGAGHRRHRSFAGFLRAALPPEAMPPHPWRRLPPTARRAALRALLGRDPRLTRGAVRVQPPGPPPA